MSTASLEDRTIVVRLSFADLLSAKRLSGGTWDPVRKAYTFPATIEHALAIREGLPGVAESDGFQELCTSQVAAPPDPVVSDSADTTTAIPLPPAPEEQPSLVVPEGMRTQPWRHQRIAYKFCLDRFAQGSRGVLLACGMGTGKSGMAIMLVLGLAAKRVLIACPLRVVQVWVTQFERHTSIEYVIVALDEDAGSVANKRDIAEVKMRLARTMGVPFICVVNYDSIWRDPLASWVKKQSWDLAIADECVPPATMIATPNGSVPIESVHHGDVVLGTDRNGRITTATVTATFRRVTAQPLIRIETLRATPNHPVWVEGSGYVAAAGVRVGDRIRVYEDNNDYLRVVRSVINETAVGGELEASLLQPELLGEMEDVTPGFRSSASREEGQGEDARGYATKLEQSELRCGSVRVPAFGAEPVSQSRDAREVSCRTSATRVFDAKRR